MTTNFYPSNLQWVGLAKETVSGTPQATPTIWVPVDSPKWEPKINPLPDHALRGLMGTDFQQQAGMRYDTLSYKTYFYKDSIFPHFLGLLGNPDTVTGSADPYTHKTALYNGSGSDEARPPTYTGFYIDAAGKCWQIPGMVLTSNKVSVKVDELDSMDIVWTGLPATAITPPTNTPTTQKPMPAWNSTITLGGSPTTALSECSIEYKRDAKPANTINGTQAPLKIYAGAVTVSGSLTAVYQGSTDVNLVDYLANTQPALVVVVAAPGDATHSLTLQHSVVAYDVAAVNGSGQWMEVASTVKALMNATDALDSKQSPVQVVYTSTQSAAY